MTTYCGVDFHARQQSVAWCDPSNGEIHFRQLAHQSLAEVREFYAALPQPVIVGLEASGYSTWFENLLDTLGCEVRIGDAFAIRARARSRQKTDRRDAELGLDLLLKDEFPSLHRPTPESRAVLQQLRYRHRLVQLRTRIVNSLHALALSAGVSLKAKLLTKAGRQRLEQLPLSAVLQTQRDEWLLLLDFLQARIQTVEQALEQQFSRDALARSLATQPGLGALTSLALVHTLNPVTRFRTSRQVVAYIGLEPREYSSGERQRFGGISKRGSRLLRFLLVEAAHTAVHPTKGDAEIRRVYQRLKARRGAAKAQVAAARHLLVHAYIMLRDRIEYAEFVQRGVTARSARLVQKPAPTGGHACGTD